MDHIKYGRYIKNNGCCIYMPHARYDRMPNLNSMKYDRCYDILLSDDDIDDMELSKDALNTVKVCAVTTLNVPKSHEILNVIEFRHKNDDAMLGIMPLKISEGGGMLDQFNALDKKVSSFSSDMEESVDLEFSEADAEKLVTAFGNAMSLAALKNLLS